MDLLESVRWSSVTVAGLFGVKLLKKHHHLQLEHAGKTWSILRMSSRDRKSVV